MKKKAGLVRKIFVYPLIAVVGLMVLLSGGNAVMTAVERGTHEAPGRLVEVGGKTMHVYTVGQGSPNVVLLSGLGTFSPLIDFSPLARELQSRARVTTLEYPGYGWSQDTDEPRSTQTSVDEMRRALSLAGLKPPYVLVAHSISGLQALAYAHRYPDEVAGIVGLDATNPGQLPYMPTMVQSDNTYEILRWLGVVRVALLLNPGQSGAQTGELTPEQVRDFGMITNWNVGSHAIANETNQVLDNLKAAQGLQYPSTIPVTLVLASQAVAAEASGIPGDVWRAINEAILQGHPNGKVVVLVGDHYIHHHNAKAVAELVFDVLDKVGRSASQGVTVESSSVSIRNTDTGLWSLRGELVALALEGDL